MFVIEVSKSGEVRAHMILTRKMHSNNSNNLQINNDDKYPDTPEFPAVGFNYIPSSSSSNSGLQVRNKHVKKAIKSVDDQVSTKKWITKREKVEKIIAKKYQKNIQPGECMKFLKIDFDEELEKFNFYQESWLLLDNANVKMQKKPLFVPNSLNWTRLIEINNINSNNEIDTVVREESQQYVMIIWNWDEVVKKIHNQSFMKNLIDINTLLPGKKLSFVIYGIEGYFTYHRANNRRQKLATMYQNINESPKISRKEFECLLVEAQITLNCHIILIENSQEMSLMILQHTKAIAEIPYKMALRETEVDKIDFYAIGDNKNTVKVDGDGFGLRRLWLRQHCLFNNAGLATAEAICAIYPSPLKLMKAYANCSADEGVILLKDIPVKRRPGEVCTTRKIGPELSRKIYTMFTSISGTELLN